MDHAHVGPQLARHIDGVVRREAVDDDHLVQVRGQVREDVRQVARLVQGRHHHADGGCRHPLGLPVWRLQCT
jgi:hypothetical protein